MPKAPEIAMMWNTIKSKWKKIMPLLISYTACLLVMCTVMLGYRMIYRMAAGSSENVRPEEGPDNTAQPAGIPISALPPGTIVAVQQKLSELGFLTSEPDGIYSVETAEAVRAFQRSVGLTADGVCHIHTLEALGLTAPDPSPP